MKTVPDPVKRELCARFGGNPSSLKFLGGGRDWSDGTLLTFPPADKNASRIMVLKILEFAADDDGGLALAEDRLDRLDFFLQHRRCLLFMPFQEQAAQHPAWRERWKRRILEENKRLLP